MQKCLLLAQFQSVHTITDTTQEENKSAKFQPQKFQETERTNAKNVKAET